MGRILAALVGALVSGGALWYLLSRRAEAHTRAVGNDLAREVNTLTDLPKPEPDVPAERESVGARDEGDKDRAARILTASELHLNIAEFMEYEDQFAGTDPYDSTIWALRETQFGAWDPALIKAIILAESNGNQRALNYESVKSHYNTRTRRNEPNGSDWSCGLMQIRTDTARFVNGWWDMSQNTIRDRLLEPTRNIFTGWKYLQWQASRYSTRDLEILAAAWNAGSVFRDDSGDFVNRAYINRIINKYKIARTQFPSEPQYEYA